MGIFKGTKGKWFACCIEAKPHFLFTNDGETTICAFTKKQDSGIELQIEEVRANAKLISCAPEMLEMLIDLKDYLGSDKRQEVELLIKKATDV